MQEIKINHNDGYVFNTKSEKLEFFKYEKAVFNFESGIVKYYGKLGGIDAEITDEPRYETEENFKRGVTNEDVWTMSKERIQNKRGLKYVFKNGEAMEVPQDADYEVAKCSWDVKLASGEKAYGRKEEVYDYNDLVVIDENGVERVVKCAASKMALTEEQKKLVAQFNEIVDKMDKAKLTFVHNTMDGLMSVLNVANTTCIEFDCDRYTDDGWSEVSNMCEPTKMCCSYINDDTCINVMF